MSFFDAPDRESGAMGDRGLSEILAGDGVTLLGMPRAANRGDSKGLRPPWGILPTGPWGLFGGNMLAGQYERPLESLAGH